MFGAHKSHQFHHACQCLSIKTSTQEFREFLNLKYKGHATVSSDDMKLWVTHKLLAVLLSCAGAEQLHVEEGQNSK